MTSEEEKTDLACLQAIQDMGGFVTLKDWLYSLYSKDIVLSYDEFGESYCRLIKNRFITKLLLIGCSLTARGRAVLRGEQVPKKVRKRETKPFRKYDFITAKKYAFEQLEIERNEKTKEKRWAGVLGVFLWLLSIACLAGGIIFACLFQGNIGWKYCVPILGVILYIALGIFAMVAGKLRCSYRLSRFLSIVCFPSLGLLALIAFFSYGA